MKIEDVILEHKNWKIKISDYIYSPDKSLRPESCHERCCLLTKWLDSEEAHALLSKKEREEISKAHKLFHHTIAEIILNANRGVKISEELAIGIDSTFHRNSENLIRLLSKVKTTAQAS